MSTATQTHYKQTEIGEIPQDWNIGRLGSFCEVKGGKRLPKGESLIETKTDHPYIRIKDITKDGINKSNLLYLTKSTHQKIKRYIICEGDVYISIVGTIGLSGIIDKELDGANLTENAAKLFNFNGLDSKYLSYFLKSPTGQRQIRSRTVGSTQPKLALFRINDIVFPLAELGEQQQISSILSSLDDKIELNRRMNKTLEDVGKVLFKHWFVDFEFPNNEGRQYKSSGGKMVKSELGEMPDEWKAGYLPEVVKILKGLSYSGKDLADKGSCALVGLKCFERQGGFRVDGIKYYNGEFKNDHLLETGDLVIAMTDLTQAAEVIGNPAIIPFIPNINRAVASLDVSIIKPTSYLSREYLYLLLARQESQDFLYGYTNGSTVLHLSIKGLYEFKLFIPPKDLLEKFDVLIKNMFFQIKKNQNEIINLTALRDSLLPRLMSGKLRVN